MAKLYSEELTDFTKEQKDKLMQIAAKDENYIERVNHIQAEKKGTKRKVMVYDPYQVLGVARGASDESIVAKRKSKYHCRRLDQELP